MERIQALLERLDAIGRSLAVRDGALALLGLGSVGVELDRLDEWSDLDFFVIVREGYKARYVDQLDWLEAACPIVYGFRNTPDGCKVMFEDGIFIEYAVFEPWELARIPFAGPRMVWSAPEFDPALAIPPVAPSVGETPSMAFRLGEAVTNLYVGMLRYHRGEKLSAARFIQQYAVDQIVKMAPSLAAAQPGHVDPFTAERRFEQRYPEIAAHLPEWVAGYDRIPESALAILRFLEAHFEVNPAMKDAIVRLCEGPSPPSPLPQGEGS